MVCFFHCISMMILDINPQYVGITAGILTSFSLVPQLTKMIKEKKAQDISLAMLLCLLAGVALWTVYGFMRDDVPIIATNMFSFLVNCAILITQFIYEKKGMVKQ